MFDGQIRLIIAGGRDFNKGAEFVDAAIADFLIDEGYPSAVLSGCAKGADKAGEKWATTDFVPPIELEKYPPQWNLQGNQAGILRNIYMADNATHLIAFWDGKSRGTKHMIETATAKGLKVKVVRYVI